MCQNVFLLINFFSKTSNTFYYFIFSLVRFRTIPITTDLKAFNNIVDVYMIDPNGHIMKRWLSRQSNLGTVSLSYLLADQPVFGAWKIRVVAQGQVEENSFMVEEYYQTRFEVRKKLDIIIIIIRFIQHLCSIIIIIQ